VNSRDALRQVEEALQGAGKDQALDELRRAVDAVETAATHAQSIKEITRALLESEKTYRLVFSHELDPISLFDPATGKILDVNEAWLALYGYSRDEALAMRVVDVSAEPATTRDAIDALPPGGVTRIDVRWHKAKDGTVFPVELSAGSLTLGERSVMYAVMRDITQRRRAELALAKSEASYRALIESMPDAVLVHRHGTIVYVNPACRSLLGYGADEPIAGKPVIDVVHPDDHAIVAERIAGVVAHGRTAPRLEERIVRKDGTTLVAEVTAYATVFDGEPAVIVIARDVTSRKQIEAQLIMNDRLASIGRLAASVGHELNNPLAYVLGNLALLEREVARAADLEPGVGERLSTHVGIIKDGAVRMRDIVNDLKTLARGDGDQGVPIDVQHVLDVCVNMAEHELRPRARLVKDYRCKPSVSASEARMGQVFLNLIINAAQAIPAGKPEEHEVRLVLMPGDGQQVVVEVHDTGLGIAAEHAAHIFEPFFTTKQGVGTGLGLPVSHTIVTSMGGTIAAEARPGGGTIFRVVLPTTE
jgi:two-component system NtrC family sensor kinase